MELPNCMADQIELSDLQIAFWPHAKILSEDPMENFLSLTPAACASVVTWISLFRRRRSKTFDIISSVRLSRLSLTEPDTILSNMPSNEVSVACRSISRFRANCIRFRAVVAVSINSIKSAARGTTSALLFLIVARNLLRFPLIAPLEHSVGTENKIHGADPKDFERKVTKRWNHHDLGPFDDPAVKYNSVVMLRAHKQRMRIRPSYAVNDRCAAFGAELQNRLVNEVLSKIPLSAKWRRLERQCPRFTDFVRILIKSNKFPAHRICLTRARAEITALC